MGTDATLALNPKNAIYARRSRRRESAILPAMRRSLIRYPYYRCRSTAGGRPPCVGVNVHCGELESLVSTILSQPNTSDPPEMSEIADHLNRLDVRSKRDLLPKILDRVIWNHADREITLDIKDDAVTRLDEAIQSQMNSGKEPS